MAPGKRDANFQTWILEVSHKITTLIRTCMLQVAVVFVPISFPTPIHDFKKYVNLPSTWTTICLTIRNCSHGGAIETDHFAIVFADASLSNYIKLPTTTAPPAPMSSILLRHTLPTINIETGDLTLSNPSHPRLHYKLQQPS